MKKALIAAAAAALAAHLFMGFSFINSSSATYDEPIHIASGYAGLATGRHFLNILDHPPLAETAAALPLLALGPDPFYPVLKELSEKPYHAGAFAYGDLLFYRNTVAPEKMLNAARTFSFLLWSLLGSAAVFFLARELHSARAGFLALTAFFLTPAVVSNNALAGTDAAPSAFYAAAFLFGLLSSKPGTSPGGGRLYAALAGAAAGLAMASKFSMFIAGPLILALWAMELFRSGAGTPRELLARSAIFTAAALAMIAAAYNFEPGLYLQGLAATLRKITAGKPSFAAGLYLQQGAWWYFPLALAIKTPLLLLASSAGGAVYCALNFSRKWLWLVIPAGIYFILAMNSGVLLGVRHILPVIYLLAVFSGVGLAWLGGKKAGLIGLAPLAALLVWGLAKTHPFHLAYFNELAGGPAGGYKYLVDSNLDWGQGVKPLADKLRAEGGPPVIFSYFGTARPEAYGIEYFPLAMVSNIPLTGTGVDVCAMDRVLLAVSATNLQGAYYIKKHAFAWLKKEKPAFSAGYSIFLYDLTSKKKPLIELAGLFDLLSLGREAACLRQKAGGGQAARNTTTRLPKQK